jgi:hypothetical protein
MALTDASKVAIALKKVQGKSQTKTESELYNEPFISGLSLASKTIFAETPSGAPSATLGAVTDGVVEKLRFLCEYIPGTDTIAGRHAFKLRLLSDYESTSNNANKATGSYLNSAILADSGGRLQLIPPSFGDSYIAKVYYGSLESLTEIPLTDPRDWNLDYFNGIIFQQDPPADVNHNPTYVDAYLYVGEYLDSVVSTIPSSSSAVATGLSKFTFRCTSTIAAMTNVTFTGLSTADVPSDASLSVFLNGDLLLQGDETTTTAYSNSDPRLPSTTNTHFWTSGTSTLQFGFALYDGDYVVVEKRSFIANINPRTGLVVDTSGSNYNIDVDYAGADSVIKSATDGTAITVDEENDYLLIHDATDNTVKYVKAGQVGSTSGGTIGDPEDGTYTDGLFTDFVTSTPIGTAIDRFNEILSALSPSPAPNLDNVSETTTNGITAFLSFGAANNQTSQSPAYPSVLDTAGIGSAVDVNSSYAFTSSGNNIRLGIYNGTQDITGILNDDVSSNSQGGGFINFPENSFSDGDSGTLELEVNGSVLKSINLSSVTGTGGSGLGTANELNGNSSGFTNLSTATTGTFSNGNSFSTFKHRTGKYIVKAADQRNGWNYLRVNHVKSGATSTTNYVEWVNDSSSDALASAGNTLAFVGSGSIHLSGIEYFKSGSLTYKNRVTNAYKYIYDNTDITFSTSNSATLASGQTFNFVAQNKPTINTGAGETHAKTLHLTASSDIDASFFINGQVTVGSNVTHPIKSNLANSGQATANQIMMYNLSNTSTALSETFRQENYRIVSSSYDTQASVVNSSNVWDSQKHMTASNGGHSNGLQFYNSSLLSPINTISSGDFSGFSNGPGLNPDYSGISGTRTFIRWFKNETGATQYDLSLAINGSGTIVQEGTSLNSSRLSALIKLPGSTGWMDVAQEFVLDSFGDTAGAHVDNDILNFDSSLNATNYLNFGNVGIADDNYIVLKIIADESWTGNISNITIDFGAGTGSLTAVPDLDDVECDQDGVDANLSFGAAKSITGYDNPTSAAGFDTANLNALYETDVNNNNHRRSVFNGATTLEGHLNADVSSPGNDFVARAFADANSGSIKLEVNGAVIHTLELTGSQTLISSTAPGAASDVSSLNEDGSGFQNISRWEPGLFDNGVPRYSEIQRTAKYKIVPASQRTGWNYARVIHTVGGSDRNTNFIEWVNDPESTALSSSSGLSTFGDNSHSYISGVKYFNSPSGSILTAVSHIYKNIYSDSNSAISFTSLTQCSAVKIVQAGLGLSATKTTSAAVDSLQTLATSTNSQNEVLHVTGTINFSQAKSLPGTRTTAYSCGAAMVFDHPLKSNHTTATQSTTNLLVWTPSDTSNLNTNEYFTGETYRLVSGSYTAQSDVAGGSNNWNSQRSMNDQDSYPEHATGLLVYDTYLCPPKDGGSSGDFRGHSEGGSIESPVGNVNYSSSVLTNAIRDHYRKFQNNTTNDLPAINITLYGDANLVASSGAANTGALGSNKNIFIDVSIPGKTGFLDLAKPTAGSGNVSTGDGCLSGDIDQSIDSNGAINRCTFNGVTVDGTVSGAEYIIIRVTASKDWTGYLEQIAVSWS